VTYKTIRQLMGDLAWAERLGRDAFEQLLTAMQRVRLIASEEAVFEADNRIIPYRKLSLTEAGFDTRITTPLPLLLDDGLVEEFAESKRATSGTKPKAEAKDPGSQPRQAQPKQKTAPVELTAEAETLAARLKEWRAEEAKRLRVPAFVVMHDRTLRAVAAARPANPRQLLEINGIGPEKAERFGAAILELCAKLG
jgi:ATP-dependent DNA helicase RecQ